MAAKGTALRKKAKAAPKKAPKKATARVPRPQKQLVLVATRKGAWIYHGDAARKTWRADGPHFLGHIIHHLVLDPRDGKTLLAAASTGHLGPTIFRSTDLGKSWKEAARPPAFKRKTAGRRKGPQRAPHLLADPGACQRAGRLVCRHLAARPVPQRGWRRHLDANFPVSTTIRNIAPGWAATRTARPTGRSCIPSSSIRAIPGIFISACRAAACMRPRDGGANWSPLVEGMEVVEGFDAKNLTFHDPHCVRLCPSNPDRLYQQNHCGIYRLDRPGTTLEAHRQGDAEEDRRYRLSAWSCIRATTTPPGCCRWTARRCGRAPASRASPRSMSTSDGGKAGSAGTRACRGARPGGRSSARLCTADNRNPVGLYFGTTSGELWTSPRRRPQLEPASPGTCRRSMRWRPPASDDRAS